MNNILYYTVPARIHISLYDMNGNLGRINGGIGFAINEPCLKFQIEKNDKICITLIGKTYCVSYMDDLLKFIMNKFNVGGVKLTLYNLIPEHCGFGSGTITRLAVSKAYLDLYDKNISFSELALILKRGGTSGIGVNIIDKGGFIFDGGRRVNDGKINFKPSSAQDKIVIPPILFHCKMLDLKILLLVPEEKGLSGKEEIEFFLETCPINKNVVEKLARIIDSQILPALCEKDINIFCQAINSIQDLDWKKNEICRYSKGIQNFIKNLQKIGYGVGLSSTGPCIYVLGNDFKKAMHEINNTNIRFKVKIITKPNNYGIKKRKKLGYLY